MVKKKRSIAQVNEAGKQESEDLSHLNEDKVTSTTEQTELQQSEKILPLFKDPKFVHSGKPGTAGKRTRIWKSLKQITAADRLLPLPARDISYSNIESPPSTKPARRYSDISGLQAKYTDPLTKLRFANSDEFAKIRTLSPDIINGYLLLRRANNPVP